MIDINVVEQHCTIIPDLFAAYDLTGCDTVATYFGIGKTGVLKVLQSGHYSLSSIDDASRLLSGITSQAT